MGKFASILTVTCLLVFFYTLLISPIKKSVSLEGKIDEVCTAVEEIKSVNDKINPLLGKLRESEFFRIFKVNLENECPFWEAEGFCMNNKCVVGECNSDEVPEEFKMCNKTFEVERNLQKSEESMINSFTQNKNDDEWMKIEEQDEKAIFVNLMKNGHAWTYFNGSHIWDAIYKEN